MYTNYDYNTSVSLNSLEILAGTWIFSLIICILLIASMWKIFKKAGKHGWGAIIPIYNIIVMLEICEIPVWQIILYIIPFANIYITFKTYIQLAKKFGKGAGFGVFMVFFTYIGLPILAFSKCKYVEEQSEHEPSRSILDVNEVGVPNSSEASDFSYGYEKEETVVMPRVDVQKEEVSSTVEEKKEDSLNQEDNTDETMEEI